LERWRVLEGEFGTDLEIAEEGTLQFAVTEEEARHEQEIVRQPQRNGVAAPYLTPAEVRRLVPVADGTYHGAAHPPSGGHADALKTSIAYAQAAERAGVRMFTGVDVTDLRVSSGRVQEVVCAGGLTVKADLVVNCAGAWAIEIMKMVGRKVPIAPRRA